MSVVKEIRLGARINYLFVACLIFYSLPYFISREISTPTELVYDCFSSLLTYEGKIQLEPEWDEFFDFSGFIPIEAVYNTHNQGVPHGGVGFIFLVAAAKLILPDQYVFFLNPLLGTLAILLFYKIVRTILKDERNAFYSTLLLATTPVFAHWTNLFYPDILNLIVFLLAFWKLLKVFQGNEQKDYLLFGFYCGLLVWIRYSSIVLLLPLAILIYLHRGKVQRTSLFVSMTVTSSMILLLLPFFLHIYGGFFITGYGDIFEVAWRTGSMSFIYHLINAPLSFHLAFPPIILAILGIFVGYNRDKANKSFYIFFFILSVVTILFFARQRWYGTVARDLTLNASYLRYLLPFFVFLPLFTIIGLSSFNLKIRNSLIILLVFNALILTFGPYGIIHTNLNKLYHRNVSDFIMEHTDRKTVILTSYWNHVVFPRRISFSRTGRLIAKEEVLQLTDRILERGYSFCYVYNDQDGAIARILESRYKVRMVSGPNKLNPILRIAPIPKHIYPLHLYLVKKEE